MRKEVPANTQGSEKARRLYTRERIMDPPSGETGKRVFLGVRTPDTEVCVSFFEAVTGISRSTINKMGRAGTIER